MNDFTIVNLQDLTEATNLTVDDLLAIGQGSKELKKAKISQVGVLLGISSSVVIGNKDIEPTIPSFAFAEAGLYPEWGNVEIIGNLGILIFDGTNFSKTEINFIANGVVEEGNTQAVSGGEVFLTKVSKIIEGKNKFNKTTATLDTLVDESGDIVPFTGWSTSEKIQVLPNTNYAYTAGIIALFNSNNVMVLRQNWTQETINTGVDGAFFYYSVGSELLNNSQVEIGNAPTSYEPFIQEVLLNSEQIEDNSISKDKLNFNLLEGIRRSKNLANYREFKDGFYISEIDGTEILNSAFCVTPFIDIEAGVEYIQTHGNRVAFYDNSYNFISGLIALDNAFITPSNTKYLKGCTEISTKQQYQLEKGNVKTSYEDYETVKLPKEKVIGLDDNIVSRELKIPTIKESLKNICPIFYEKYKSRNEDVTIVLNGESISTTNYYATPYADAKNRPPLMTEMNYTTMFEELLRWEGQKYYRFDTGLFTEIGTATTKEYDLAWDWTKATEEELPANNNRPAVTRILTGTNCSVSYLFPINNKRCDFIFRTDYLNADNAVVSITQGNGIVQVYNETSSTWVEANGFSYSAKEDGTLLPGQLYKSMYQKRLKMRKVNISSTANITITNNGSGRLTYWGIQTSPISYMFDFILSARGGHSITRLENFEAWDTDYFKPQLIMWQIPVINEGLDVGNSDFTPKTLTKTKEQYSLGITNKYVDYIGKSYAPEVYSYILWFGRANNGMNDSNEWVFGNDPNGNKVSIPTYLNNTLSKMSELNYNCIDVFNCIYEYAKEKSKDSESNINNVITDASGMNGDTLTIDGVHYNTNGNTIVYKMFNYLM